MTLHRRLSLFVAIGALSLVPASAFIRNATSSGTPLTRSDSSGIQVLVNGSMMAGETNSSGTAVITASSNPMQAVTAAAAEWSAVSTALVTFAPPQPTTATNNPNDGQYVVTCPDRGLGR